MGEGVWVEGLARGTKKKRKEGRQESRKRESSEKDVKEREKRDEEWCRPRWE